MKSKNNFATYVISLRDSKKRRESIAIQLKKQNINDYKIIDAVRGSDLTASEKKSFVFQNKKGEHKWYIKLNNGQIGCSLSHIKAYKELLKTNYQFALILEDDAIFNEELSDILKDTILDNFNKNAQITLLSELKLFYKKPITKIKNKGIVKVLTAVYSHSYFINRSAAINMINFNFPVKTVADNFMLFWLYCDIDIYGIDPFIVDQNQAFQSDIDTMNEIDEIKRIEKTIKIHKRHILYKRKLHKIKIKFLKNLIPNMFGSHFKGHDF